MVAPGEDHRPNSIEEREVAATLGNRGWRLRNLYLIRDEAGILRPLELRAEQEEFLSRRHHRNFVPKARKLGMSTIIVLDNLDACIWDPGTTAAHVDKTLEDAIKKLAIARLAWQHGPNHPDPVIAEIWRAIHAKTRLIADSATKLEWSNGSIQTAGTSFVGGTPQRLHVSEYGPIAAQQPERSREILRGSINAVPVEGIVDVETTMEGGPFGECYQLFKLALERAGQDDELTPLDWRLHFFPWFGHPSYDLVLDHKKPLLQETVEYFEELESKHGIVVSHSRKVWYESKRREQREQMWTQYPSIPSECVRTTVAGQIYPEVTTLRAKKRVYEFEHERGLPMFTAWDLGISDFTDGWVIQPAARELLWLAWYEGEGHGAAKVADVIRAWEGEFGMRFSAHFVPHDADTREKGSGESWIHHLINAGIPRESIVVVPRTPDVWVGINALRDLLPRSWFHSRCDVQRLNEDGVTLPSGLDCLENYRKTPPTPGGVLREMPLHDACSHTADAARTFAEAWKRGLVSAWSESAKRDTRGKARVITGTRR